MAAVQTNGSGVHTNVDFYAGYTRFEIELEVDPSSRSVTG